MGYELAQLLRVPRLRLHNRAAAIVQRAASVRRLPPTDISHRMNYPRAHQVTADYLVSRNLQSNTVKEQAFGNGALMRRSGVSYNTAWMLKQKLMQVMLEREAVTMLTERVEIDDAYIGGERTGGKVSRGAESETPFVAAVQTDFDGRPHCMELHKINGFNNEQIDTFAEKKLKAQANVYTDGLACFAADINNGCSHTVTVSGGYIWSVLNPSFKYVNTALGNIKSSLMGTYRHISSKHVARYLAEIQYRFNRRNELAGMLSRVSYVSLRTPPMPYKLLKLAEASA